MASKVKEKGLISTALLPSKFMGVVVWLLKLKRSNKKVLCSPTFHKRKTDCELIFDKTEQVQIDDKYYPLASQDDCYNRNEPIITQNTNAQDIKFLVSTNEKTKNKVKDCRGVLIDVLKNTVIVSKMQRNITDLVQITKNIIKWLVVALWVRQRNVMWFSTSDSMTEQIEYRRTASKIDIEEDRE